MRCMCWYEANINTFKCCLNVISANRRIIIIIIWQGFHADGSAAEKGRRAVVLSRQHGMTRSCRLADQKNCCRDVTLEAGWQKSIKYCGAWPCIQLYVMTLSLFATPSGVNNLTTVTRQQESNSFIHSTSKLNFKWNIHKSS